MGEGDPRFDERAEWFDAHYRTTRGRIRLDLILERIGESFPPPPARILDAGGGSGAVAVTLAARGYEVTLLDPSEGMLRVARERIESRKVDIRVIADSIEAVASHAPGPYDAICCHAVLMYLDRSRVRTCQPSIGSSTRRSVVAAGEEPRRACRASWAEGRLRRGVTCARLPIRHRQPGDPQPIPLRCGVAWTPGGERLVGSLMGRRPSLLRSGARRSSSGAVRRAGATRTRSRASGPVSLGLSTRASRRGGVRGAGRARDRCPIVWSIQSRE